MFLLLFFLGRLWSIIPRYDVPWTANAWWDRIFPGGSKLCSSRVNQFWEILHILTPSSRCVLTGCQCQMSLDHMVAAAQPGVGWQPVGLSILLGLGNGTV